MLIHCKHRNRLHFVFGCKACITVFLFEFNQCTLSTCNLFDSPFFSGKTVYDETEPYSRRVRYFCYPLPECPIPRRVFDYPLDHWPHSHSSQLRCDCIECEFECLYIFLIHVLYTPIRPSVTAKSQRHKRLNRVELEKNSAKARTPWTRQPNLNSSSSSRASQRQGWHKCR